PPMVAGGLAVLGSGLMLTGLAPRTPVTLLLAAYAVFGFGSGLVNPPITNTAVSGMPPSQAGVAAAVASTSRQVGQTLGVAALGALAGGAVAGAMGPGFATATHISWWITVALGFLVLALALLTTTPWAQRTAQKTAERFSEDHRPSAVGEQRPARARGDQAEPVPS